MNAIKGGDFLPEDGDREQHELPPVGMYEAVIAEVSLYWKDWSYEGDSGRKQVISAHCEIDCVDKEGKRFVVSSPPSAPSMGSNSNIITKFMGPLGLTRQGCTESGGVNAYMKGKGLKFMIVHSKPRNGIQYANMVPDTLELSDNNLTVSDLYQTQFERFPDSQWENPEEHSNGDGNDEDGLPEGM